MADPAQNDPTLMLIQSIKGPFVDVQLVPSSAQDEYGGPSYTPIYRYRWADLTYLDVQSTQNGGTFVVGGTALESAAPQAQGQTRYQRFEQDGQQYNYDPTTGSASPIGGMPGPQTQQPEPLIRQGEDGRYYSIDPITGTAKLVEGMGAKQADAGAPDVRQFPDGSLRQWNAQTRQWEILMGAQPKAAESYGPSTYAQAELYRLQAEKARQDLLPPQQLLVQQHFQTIKSLQEQIARGDMDPSEADRYIQQSRALLDATLRGTTPYQEAQAKQADERNRQQMAQSAITSKLSAANSLGSSLTSSILSAAGSVMMPKGKTSFGLDPLTLAVNYSNQQGGNELSALAQALLQGGQGGGQAAPMGPQAGAAASGPMSDEELRQKYPEAYGGQYAVQ